ncbi:MAG TPA: ATP-binding protein [Bacteroidales bacterium]|nr:ATP-binding protein [Bacteroidales bacterium]
MNNTTLNNIKLRHIIILTVFLIISVSIAFLFKADKNSATKEIIDIEKTEKILDEKFSNLKAETEYISENINTEDFNEEDYFYSECKDLFEESETGLFLYSNNNLKYWTTNSIPVPTSTTYGFFDTTIINLNNGWYMCYSVQKEDFHIVGLYQIKKEYNYENDIIKNSFSKSLKIDESTAISIEPVKGSEKVCFNNKNSCIFLISDTEKIGTEARLNLAEVFKLFAFVTFILLLVLLCVYISNKNNLFAAISPVIILIIFSLIRYLMLKTEYTQSLSDFKLFSPELFAESFWLPSLGEYILNVFAFFIFSLTFLIYYKPRFNVLSNLFIRTVFSISIALLMFLSGSFISDLFYGLVWNSSISFSFENPLSLDVYSFIGVTIVFTIILSFVFIFYRLIKILKNYISPILLSISLLVFHVISIIFNKSGIITTETNLICTGLFLILWLSLGLICLKKDINYLFSFIFVITISLITSEHFSRFSNQKEIDAYKVITYNLAAERDVAAEFFLMKTYNEIKVDVDLAEYIINQDFKGITNRINNILQSKRYFNKYETQTTICLCKDSLLIEPDMVSVDCFDFFRNQIDTYGIIIPGTNFYFLDNHNGRISYLGEISTKLKDSLYINIYVELNSKIFSEGLGYPEMLLDKKLIVKKTAKKYNYAKYNKGRLISSKGDYKYQFTLKPEINDSAEYSIYTSDGYIHFKYRPDPDNIIILSKPDTQFSKELVSFTYIFVFVFLIFNILWLFKNFKSSFKKGASLKVKIQTSFVAISVISLLLTGTLSIYFIIQGYKQKQREAVLDKTHSVIIELEHKVGDLDKLNYEDSQYLNTLLVKFSNVFYTDINLYDLNGLLLSSSRIELYDKGLKGRYMEPEAYRQLLINNAGTVIINENIDNINYLSAYIPFRNYDNEIIAYLNLPYFARQSEFTEEISNFIIAFSNIFLLLIILSVIISVFISRQLTRPLVIIQEKIKSMDIKKKAEKISYIKNDELGGLIREYNRKVDELSESANKLAQSEREMAWREMAKQIAHEIKNPLTPMKLSVQYLERTYDMKDENWEQTYRKVSKTLIEQIDILSGIASEFSNFAKMPTSKKEIINLPEIINTSVQLFENTENIDFNVIIDIKSMGNINADKEQMLRVFNNLIKNSIQAIPEDRKGNIDIILNELEKSYIVKIVDNGCGIPEYMKPKIFQPNFTTKSAGMGLGLSMVKSMLISNNATIHFNTEEGIGTEFIIEIPIEKD